jgi:hypothetical protein
MNAVHPRAGSLSKLTHTKFIGNTGIEDGADGVIDGYEDRYLMWLETGRRGGGNIVDWNDNHLSPYRYGFLNTWSGNYPDKTGDPYYHAIQRIGFILSPYSSDKISP